ncbi:MULTISPECIES: SGNH/GDSL hydrolase family protein [unclassified Microbacterium]|uniref:SGNH/GDSL hydrolase family protein n=1 Tax=unclassified Microbacterium TaxID=2609290 RepID=UPI00300FCF75
MADIYPELTNIRGPAARITSVTAESVPADQAASVVMSGPDQNRHFHFRTPRGLPGVNAVAADSATATYVGQTDTETYAAVANRMEEYRRTVPAYVTAAGMIPEYSVEYDPSLRLFNGSAADLVDMITNIAWSKQGYIRTNILFIGDSKTAGSAVGYEGSVPLNFMRMAGALDGVAFAAHAVSSAPDGRWSGVTGFTATGTSMHLNAAVGVNTAKFQGIRRATGLRLLWNSQSATLASHSVSFDGAAGVPLAPDGVLTAPGATTGYYYKDFTGADANHSLELTINMTAGSFQLLGIESLHGSTGVTVTNAGLHGSFISGWDPTSTSRLGVLNATAGIVSQLPGRRVAIVQLGTNVSADMPAGYRALVERLRVLGYEVLIVVPGGVQNTADRITLKRALYDIAADLSMPLADFNDLIGNSIAADRGYMADTLHENARGYRYEAWLLWRILCGS